MFKKSLNAKEIKIMAGAMLTATIFDIIAVMAIILGFINEDKLIELEDRIIFALGRAYKRYMRRRYIKKKAAQKAHLHAVPSQNNKVLSFSKTA